MYTGADVSRKVEISKKDTIFAESTFNDTWGTGLNKEGTENTKIISWPGKNLLEHIINRISKKIRIKCKKSDQWSKPKQKQQPKVSTKQRDIAQMLRDLRQQSDSESLSGFDASTESDSEDPAKGKGQSNSVVIGVFANLDMCCHRILNEQWTGIK